MEKLPSGSGMRQVLKGSQDSLADLAIFLYETLTDWAEKKNYDFSMEKRGNELYLTIKKCDNNDR